jgi:hypothetical protein
LEWTWSSAVPNPLRFSYQLNVPFGISADAEIVASLVHNAAISESRLMVRPDPITVFQHRHSADTNADFRISLSELTRVIEIFNCRKGGERTGRYRLSSAVTEDGFDTDPASSVDLALKRYHSGDSDKNSRIDLSELTRVIQLFNFRSGTVRTGQYRILAGSEDGFAPGP